MIILGGIALFILLCVFLPKLIKNDDAVMIILSIIAVLIMVSIMLIHDSRCNFMDYFETPLYSGYNDNSIEGRFFLLGGTVGETDYVYYWTNTDGVLRKHTVQMSMSTFIEDGKNVLYTKYKVCKPKWVSVPAQYHYYEFHVPEGSVSSMYSYR